MLRNLQDSGLDQPTSDVKGARGGRLVIRIVDNNPRSRVSDRVDNQNPSPATVSASVVAPGC